MVTSFQITNQAVQAQSDSWEIGYQTICADRIVAYGDYRLNAGVYNLVVCDYLSNDRIMTHPCAINH